MNLKKLRRYSLAEAVYIEAFCISEEDLENKPMEEKIADYTHLQENVKAALDTLQKREEVVLRLILEDKLSLREVGESLDLSAEYVRQILGKAFRKLKHPFRQRILDGTRRQAIIEAQAQKQRKESVATKWAAVSAVIEHQKSKQLAELNAQLLLSIEQLSLTRVSEQKLYALGVETIGGLLEKFPYDSQTNGLAGLATAEGIDETDYYEIWMALFAAGLLIRMPELPDFDAIQNAERAAMIQDGTISVAEIPISDLELSVRSYNCVIRRGFSTVGSLMDELNLDASKLLAADVQDVVRMIGTLGIRNLGRKSAEEIANRLRDVLSGTL